MGELARCTEVVQLRRDRLAEQRACQPGRVARHDDRLIQPVDDPRDQRHEVRLEDLDVLQETRGVSCGVPDGLAEGDDGKFHDSLRYGAVSTTDLLYSRAELKYHLIDVSKRQKGHRHPVFLNFNAMQV